MSSYIFVPFSYLNSATNIAQTWTPTILGHRAVEVWASIQHLHCHLLHL